MASHRKLTMTNWEHQSWKWKFLSCQTLCNPLNYTAHGIFQARILTWVAVPFSRNSSQPRDQTQVSHTAGRFFTSWATREALVRCKRITEADPLTTTSEVVQEFNIDHSVVIWHLKQIGKVKKLDKWVPHKLIANQKNKSFQSTIFSYFVQQQSISLLDCDAWQKNGFYMTTSDDQLRG